MAYKQNNPFSRKASPLNNGDGLDLTRVRGNRYYVRPRGDDERYDTENITGKILDERTGEVLVANKPGGRGARVDYLPSQETLTHKTDPNSIVSSKTYNLARKMMADSLDLVNRGRGVKATSIYGPNLGQDLRDSDSAGEFESNVMNTLHGVDDEANIENAKNMLKYRGGRGHGFDVRSGDFHTDYDVRTTDVMRPSEIKAYRNRRFL